MNQNRRTEDLLHKLREAIHETLAESLAVLEAMSELEDAGLCPAFSVDITLPEEGAPSEESVTHAERFVLTASDESFLRTLGITTPLD